MPALKLIRDPLYLTGRNVIPVPEHQVAGLTEHLRAMVVFCIRYGMDSMAAPEVGLHYNFFIARSIRPKDSDFDTIFEPVINPVENEGQAVVEEKGVDGKLYRVPRWRKIKMTWRYHNGRAYEEKTGEFEGFVAYVAQKNFDKLAGIYIGASDADEEVVPPTDGKYVPPTVYN